ncbi:MAG: calcium/sodium antiporter [Oscillospiraceae bacterium]|nr:calcium/sodium antiporter [Oscillospiraceae bacterium]
MWIPILLLLIGFALLIKGGDWFVDGASGIARRFYLPEILIGATVVSIGTTLPEVMVSVDAALMGSGSIAYGNALGSIICNTALIAAITVAVKPGIAARKSLVLPVVFFFIAAAVYGFAAYVLGSFSRAIGIVLLGLFVVYMVATVVRMKADAPEVAPPVTEAALEEQSGEDYTVESEHSGTKDKLGKDILLLIVGAAFIALGANLLVDNAIIVAQALGISEKVIGLTIVALGTSLPELVTAITALLKGHGSLSLGNVIGANLFNLVLVSGAAITISPFALPLSGTIGGINSSLVLDLPIVLLVMVLLTVPALIRQKLSRWQGIVLLGIYAAFLSLQFFL